MSTKKLNREFDYKWPTSGYAFRELFGKFDHEFIDSETRFPITSGDKKTLENLIDNVDTEITTLSQGISSVGEILAIAAQNKDAGIQLEVLDKLGYFLSLVGKEISEKGDQVATGKEIIDYSVIRE